MPRRFFRLILKFWENRSNRQKKQAAKYIHFDVMDGIFVPSISFGMPVLSALKGAVKQALDVHLMVTEPIRYVKEFAKCGADIITVHLEACEDVKATVDEIKASGVKAGSRQNRQLL